MDKLTVVILTGNEEKNIVKCIESLSPLCARVVVVDSLSTDNTVRIAQVMGAEVYERAWTSYADQFNWGLDHAAIDTQWTMRMDADEEITPGLVRALNDFLLEPPAEIDGVYMRRRVYFMGQWIRHGGYYPTWLLRVWRTGHGRCETRMMDEHIVVDGGRTMRMYEDIIDRNNKDLTFWTNKHNWYASREALDVLAAAGSKRPGGKAGAVKASVSGEQDASKRWYKERIYLRLPLFVRPFLYFIYRYVFKLGFLDGTRGLIFHFLQAFWYRFLVDAKLYEAQLRANSKDSAGCRSHLG